MESDRKGTHSYEVHDAQARPIVAAGLTLGIGTAIVFVIVFWLFHHFTSKAEQQGYVNPMGATGLNPALPRIEEHPAETLQDLRTHENKVLNSYGWVDKKAGVVHMPIDRAMDLVLQRGLPVRKEAAK
jgi:hypothetical protein